MDTVEFSLTNPLRSVRICGCVAWEMEDIRKLLRGEVI